jgi:hypothetical protein
MPTSGKDVFHHLQQTEQAARAKLTETQQLIQQSQARVDSVVKEKGDAIDDLARHYLPDLSDRTIAQVWGEVREIAHQALLRQSDHRRRLSDQLQACEQQRQQAEQRLSDASNDYALQLKRRDELASDLQQRLADDDAFKQLTQEAAQFQLRIDRGEANLAEINQEAQENLPNYKNNSLFQYLIKRKFGSSEYGSKGFTRRMDRWVARLSNFERNKRGYDFLTQTPARMGEQLGQWRVELDSVLKRIDDRQHHFAKEIGLPNVQQSLSAAEKQRDELSIEVDRLADQSSEARKSLSEIDSGRGAYYEDAIRMLNQFLTQQRADLIAARAQQSTDPVDDQIAARISHLSEELQRINNESAWMGNNTRQSEQVVNDLADLGRRYVAASYHDERSYFTDEIDPIAAISQVATGEASASRVWMGLRQYQRMAPGWVEQTASTATTVMQHPLTHAVMVAMGQVAGAALEEAARRAYRQQRRRW